MITYPVVSYKNSDLVQQVGGQLVLRAYTGTIIADPNIV